MSNATGSYVMFDGLGYRYMTLSIDTTTGVGTLVSDAFPDQLLTNVRYDGTSGRLSFNVAASPEGIVDLFFEGTTISDVGFAGTWEGRLRPVATGATGGTARFRSPTVSDARGYWSALRDTTVIESARRLVSLHARRGELIVDRVTVVHGAAPA